jgi:allantoicase
MTSNTAPYVKVRNVNHYIEAQKERDNNYAIIKGDGSYVYRINGFEVDGRTFESNNPAITLEPNKVSKGFRLDSRSNWFD